MNETKDRGATLDRNMGPEMDLVNRPNPWLPAYGFQIQHHHSNFQPTHEDLRANETMLVQQVDFLETILEETSDDLQSDSDRSGTTYWLGSDSENESVIHIRATQRITDDKQDGSGSECNSVVPKKRRRKNGSEASAGGSASSRDSSGSSRSSSLLQFESLERTCATLSPSNYSFDSLEYNERRIARDGFLANEGGCASPDSLEQDYGQFNGRLRPYRSFESLGEKELLSNGYATHAFAKDCDLSRLDCGSGSRGRYQQWLLTDADVYSGYLDHPVELRRRASFSERLTPSEDEYEEEEHGGSRYSGVDQLLVFGDPSSSYSHAASHDCRNSVDLRDFGLDSDDEKTRRESTFLDLKTAARLSLSNEISLDADSKDDAEPSAQLRRRHHHHHRRRRSRRSASGQLQQYAESRQSGDGGSANDGGYNFRFSDKWRSAPSLPASLLESAASSSPSASLPSYENYTRVSSVPADLDLCGRSGDGEPTLDESDAHEDENRSRVVLKDSALGRQLTDMAAIVDLRQQDNDEDVGLDADPGEIARLRRRVQGLSVKIQDAQSPAVVSAAMSDQSPKNEVRGPATPTVKTQDRPESNVLELAMAMESDVEAVVDEAIRQLGREDLAAALENAQRIKLDLLMEAGQEQRRRVKNNASYELAQQCTVDERSFSHRRRDDEEASDETPGRTMRVLNSASYELAQQCEYPRDLSHSWSKPFYRMDACEELTEPSSSGRSSRLKVSELVDEMSTGGSTTELADEPLDYRLGTGAYPKSMDNASSHRPQLLLKSESSLLTQLKKNSDFFSGCGEGDIRTPTPGSSMAAPDDELDYPCLLENKPIAMHCRSQDVEDARTRDEVGKRNRTLEDEYRTWSDFGSAWPRGRIERPAPVESDSEGEEVVVAVTAAAATAATAATTTISPLCAPVAELAGNAALVAGSSPAVDLAYARCELATELADETSAVQPRVEMSATAAKRLAMSGEPMITRCGSSATTVPPATPAPKEERKKGGLGGFLQRFSKLRFSGRSKVPRSEVQKKSAGGERAMANSRLLGKPQQDQSTSRKKKEPDFIIVPLHPTEEETRMEEQCRQAEQTRRFDLERSASNISANGRPPVCSGKKPPLPPQYMRTSGVGVADVVSAPSRRRAATDLGSPAAIEMAKARVAMLASQDRPQQQQHRQQYQQRPVGLLETDLDAPVDPEEAAASKKARSLLNLNHQHNGHHQCHHQQQQLGEELDDDVKQDGYCQRTGARGGVCHLDHHRGKPGSESTAGHQRPHKSMEFLLDKENLHFVQPPENELQKVGERVPSEHELRVQRSLQRLNVPDWYKNSPAAREGSGFRLKRHSDASQHGGWRALGSKTTSLSSLSSSSNRQPTTGTILSPSPTPPVFSRWSTSLLNSAGSSPASSARSSFNHRQPYLGWRSQERLANPRTPAERLAQGILPQLQNANKQQHQSQILQQSQRQLQNAQQLHGNQTTNQEVRNSIKEVTSAIVHYVQSGQEVVGGGGRLSPRSRLDYWDERGGARSTSPRGSSRLVWMESSFVGVRPVDSTDTPVSIGMAQSSSRTMLSSSRSSLIQTTTMITMMTTSMTTTTTTTTATFRSAATGGETSEDGGSTPGAQPNDLGSSLTSFSDGPGSLFLDLLQSPCDEKQRQYRQRSHRQEQDDQQDERRESPSPTQQQHHQHQSRNRHRAQGEQHHYRHYKHRQHHQQYQRAAASQRRRSEGSPQRGPRGQRRPSLEGASSGPGGSEPSEERLVRCRNGKCPNSASPAEARRIYKSCHNCTCLYCSRECRRAHWQRHRKTCLYSRASSLCVQVLSSVKRDPCSLGHVSALARRGYATHGRGAVRCFFASPEAAERYVAAGFQELGEPSYVRWSDILPSEMGAELYAEAVRLCESYNSETRLVLYVSVCVVREVPSTGGGAVMWERQPVSRCAKLKLDVARKQTEEQPRSCSISREMESPETLVLTSSPPEAEITSSRHVRELAFGNIQRELRVRGVSLHRHFPQVYGKLCAYVDGSVDKFAPVTIYPRDQATGRSFMCIIMLDAVPERLQLLPTDSSRLRTVDVGVEIECN